VKLITRDTDYAVRALCFIAMGQGKVITVSTLAEKLNTPRPFLRKTLQKLNRQGILKSFKGASGGFQLAARPEKIFFLDLIKVFQGDFKLNECVLKKNICPNKKNCSLKKKLDTIESYVIKELGSITIASLLK
jgi:Rrf2 family protein